MACKTRMFVSFAIRRWNPWITSYLGVCSAERSGRRVLRWLCLDTVVHVQQGNTMQWWCAMRKMIPKPLRRGFDSFFLLVRWLLWKERNARTFNRVTTYVGHATHQEDRGQGKRLWIAAGNKHVAASSGSEKGSARYGLLVARNWVIIM
jgi:hypothetical protein